MSDVVWQTHPRFCSYQVSTDGRVRSVDRVVTNTLGVTKPVRGKELRPALTAGYPAVVLCVDGKGRTRRVHVLVCETFYGPRPGPDCEVRHLNGDPTDNRLENLSWGSKSENAQDTLRHGRHNHYQKSHCKNGHQYAAENTRIDTTSGSRVCRQCQRDSWERRKAQMVRSGPKTHCKHGHELTPENTWVYPHGRRCRECMRSYARRSYWRKKAQRPPTHQQESA